MKGKIVSDIDKTEITIETYDKYAKNFENQFMDLKLYRHLFDEYFKFIKPGDTLLDLGCGPGNVAKYLKDKDNSLNLIGVDLSKEMIALAQKNVKDAQFIVNDIRNISFNENQFDGIIASFCLPFLYDNEAVSFIEKIAKYTRKNGYIFLSTMMGNKHGFEKTSFSEDNIMFFNYYSEKFLMSQYEKNGLFVEKYTVQDYHEKDGSISKDMIFLLQKK